MLVHRLRPSRHVPKERLENGPPIARNKWHIYALPLPGLHPDSGRQVPCWPQALYEAIQQVNDTVCRVVAFFGFYPELYGNGRAFPHVITRPFPPDLFEGLRDGANTLAEELRKLDETKLLSGQKDTPRRRGAHPRYPEAIKMALRLLGKKGMTDPKIYRVCMEKNTTVKEPIPKTYSTFMRTVRRHASNGKSGHK